MFFQDFDVWKLHTLTDYLFFFAMVAGFVVIVWLIIKKINGGRNDESAARRVGKRLKLKPGKGKVYSGADFDFGGGRLHFDFLLVDAAGIVAVKCIGRGLKIYGSAEADTWKITDNTPEQRRIANPIKELEGGFESMRRHLSKEGFYRVGIEPLVIFADPFDKPELYLGRDSGCIIFADLKKWMQNRALKAAGKSERLDFEKAVKALDKALIQSQGKTEE